MTPSARTVRDALRSAIASLAGDPAPESRPPSQAPLDPVADVSATLALLESAEVGVIGVAADERSARALVRILVGVDVGPDDPLLADALGELLNIAAGSLGDVRFSTPRLRRERRHAPCATDRAELRVGPVRLHVWAADHAA